MLDRLYHHIALFLLLLYPILAYAVNDDEEGSPVFDTPVNKEVSIKVKSGKLAGTLTLPPAAKGKVPAILFISGSGTQDRDESIGDYRPFRSLAESLAMNGIASLRLDDRGAGESTPPFDGYGYQDRVEDAVSALRWLAKQKEIDKDEIALLGHSEGGAIAFEVAAGNEKDVDCVVTLAAPAVRGKEMMVSQNILLMDAMGRMVTNDTQESLIKIFDAVEKGDASGIREAVNSYGANAGMNMATMDDQIKVLSSPEYIDMVRRDYGEYINKVHAPILSLNGEWDVQVDPDANLRNIKRRNARARIAVIPCANHLMQTAPNKYESLIYMAPGRKFSAEAFNQILSFLQHNFSIK